MVAWTNNSDPERPGERDLFNSKMLALMTRVLDAAWIKAQLLCGDKTRDRSIIRASMARGIIEAIESGVTDADSLVRAALSELHRADE
jgi:hypothetical protein